MTGERIYKYVSFIYTLSQNTKKKGSRKPWFVNRFLPSLSLSPRLTNSSKKTPAIRVVQRRQWQWESIKIILSSFYNSVIFPCLSVFFCEWTHITNEKKKGKIGTKQLAENDFLAFLLHNNNNNNNDDCDIATTCTKSDVNSRGHLSLLKRIVVAADG